MRWVDTVVHLGMALLEENVLDPRFGHVVNHDVADLGAHWIDEDDPHVVAMGSKGIGENRDRRHRRRSRR